MNSKIKKILVMLLVFANIFALCGCSSTSKGTVSYEGNAKDEQLNISVDAPLLIRNVEMVQYHKNDSGEVELVLANHPIDSFDNYENPAFPEELVSKVFHGIIKLNGSELSDEEINSLAYSNESELVPYTELEKDNGNEYGLTLKDGAYITASNDWNVGDIRITYSIMNIDETKEYTVLKSK